MGTRARRIEPTTLRVFCTNFRRARMAVLIERRTRGAIIMRAAAGRMRLATIRIDSANIAHARMASIGERRAGGTIIVRTRALRTYAATLGIVCANRTDTGRTAIGQTRSRFAKIMRTGPDVASTAGEIRGADGIDTGIASLRKRSPLIAIIVTTRSAIRGFATRTVNGANRIDAGVATVGHWIADGAFAVGTVPGNRRRTILIELAIKTGPARFFVPLVHEPRRIITQITRFP